MNFSREVVSNGTKLSLILWLDRPFSSIKFVSYSLLHVSVTETTMKKKTGTHMIITIVLGCLTHLFSLTAGWSIIHLQKEPVNLTSSVQLSPPVQAQLPVVIMTIPAVVGACDDLLIDLSSSWGHLGRPWVTVAWKVTSLNSTDSHRGSSSSSRLVDHVVDYLTTYFDLTTARITLPLYLWRESADVVLSLTASLTNYLQKSSSDTRVVTIHSGRGDRSGSGNSSSVDDLVATRYPTNTPIDDYSSQSLINTQTHTLLFLLIGTRVVARMKWHWRAFWVLALSRSRRRKACN